MTRKHRQREPDWPLAILGAGYLLAVIFAAITAIVALVKLTIWIWSI